MAVRIDAVADRLTNSSSYPQTSAGFTWTAWVRIDVDRNDWSSFTRFSDVSGTVANIATSSDGTQAPAIYTFAGSVESTLDLTSPATGVWACVACTRSATSGDFTVWRKRNGTGSTDSVSVDLATTDITGTPSEICLGGRGSADDTEWFNGSIAYVRVWSAELTQTEIESEWASATPIRTTDLHSDWPLFNHSDLTDTIGSKTLVPQADGNPTDAHGPIPGAENLCLNPAGDVDDTGWVGALGIGSATNNQSAGTTRVTGVTGLPKSTGFKNTSGPGFFRSAPAPVTAGLEYTVSWWAIPGSFDSGIQSGYLVWYDSSGADISYESMGSPSGGQFGVPLRRAWTATAPTGAVGVGFIQDSLTDSIVSCCLVEEGAVAHDYADGDTDGWQWNGTTGLSTSQPTSSSGGSADVSASITASSTITANAATAAAVTGQRTVSATATANTNTPVAVTQTITAGATATATVSSHATASQATTASSSVTAARTDTAAVSQAITAVASATASTGGGTLTVREQQAIATAVSTSPITFTLGSGTLTTDTLVVVQGNDWATLADLTAPTGSAASTWNEELSFDGGTNLSHFKVWTAPVTTAGAQTVDVNFTDNGDEFYACVFVLTGSPTFDGGNTATGSSSPMVAPSVTPTGADDMLFSFVTNNNGGSGFYTVSSYPSSPFTPITAKSASTFVTWAGGYEQFSSSSATGTRSFAVDTAANFAAISFLMKPSSGGGSASADVSQAIASSATVTAARTDTAASTGQITAGTTVTASRRDTGNVTAATTAGASATANTNSPASIAQTITAGATASAVRSGAAAVSAAITAGSSVAASTGTQATAAQITSAGSVATAAASTALSASQVTTAGASASASVSNAANVAAATTAGSVVTAARADAATAAVSTTAGSVVTATTGTSAAVAQATTAGATVTAQRTDTASASGATTVGSSVFASTGLAVNHVTTAASTAAASRSDVAGVSHATTAASVVSASLNAAVAQAISATSTVTASAAVTPQVTAAITVQAMITALRADAVRAVGATTVQTHVTAHTQADQDLVCVGVTTARAEVVASVDNGGAIAPFPPLPRESFWLRGGNTYWLRGSEAVRSSAQEQEQL